jgi:PUB domain
MFVSKTTKNSMFSSNDFKLCSDDCLETLHTIITNILNNPGDSKYLSVSKASKRYQSSLCDATGRLSPLLVLIFDKIGFADGVDTYTWIDKNETLMRDVADTLEDVMNARTAERQKKKPKSAFDFQPRRDLVSETRRADEQLAEYRKEQKAKLTSQDKQETKSRQASDHQTASNGGSCTVC